MPIYSKYLRFNVGGNDGFIYHNCYNCDEDPMPPHARLMLEAKNYPYDDDEKTKKIMLAFSALSNALPAVFSEQYNYELYSKADDMNYHIKASNLVVNQENGRAKFDLEFWFQTSDDYDAFKEYFNEDKKIFFNASLKEDWEHGNDLTNFSEIDNVHYTKSYKS